MSYIVETATAMDEIKHFREFNAEGASASLWVFKKRPVKDNANPFRAVAVNVSGELEAQLKQVVKDYQTTVTSAESYGLLAQPGEGEFLTIPAGDTLFSELETLVDRPLEENLASKINQLNNAAGYTLRLHSNGKTLYCIKKTNSDWATRKKKGWMNVVFDHAELEILDNPSFTIARQFDFFVVSNTILMTNKRSFESLLSHKESYEEAYDELKQEESFAAAISNMVVVDAFIGNNATHLRRMAVIRARGYYNNPRYMQRLKAINELRGWGILFDEQGRIVPTTETMRDILHILLDHRLRSELSDEEYDVPSTSPVKPK